MNNPLPDCAFRDLSPEEEKEFRDYARATHEPGDSISELWHPVVRDECRKIDEEALRIGG